MKNYVMLLTALAFSGCGGSSAPSNTNNGGDTDEIVLHKCSSDLECDGIEGTPYCVDEICVACESGNCIPACDEDTPCTEAGFHCENNQCLPGCVADTGCCPDGLDCACPDGAGCDAYQCVVAEAYCFQPERVSVCTECPDNWGCTGTLQCFVRDVCNIASDCSGGQICVNKRCAPCTANEQCPAGETCQDGACAVACSGNGDCTNGQICDAGVCAPCTSDTQCSGGDVCLSGACEDPGSPVANRLCDENSDCTHVQDGRCSTVLNPRRCTQSCNNNGQCRSEGFDSCNANGECIGSS